MYEIAFNNGGKLPKELKGCFTDPQKAEKKCRIYMSDNPGKYTFKQHDEVDLHDNEYDI